MSNAWHKRDADDGELVDDQEVVVLDVLEVYELGVIGDLFADSVRELDFDAFDQELV